MVIGTRLTSAPLYSSAARVYLSILLPLILTARKCPLNAKLKTAGVEQNWDWNDTKVERRDIMGRSRIVNKSLP